MENTTDLKDLDAPVRAQVVKELPVKERKQMVETLVECAMRMGLLDAYEIRRWLGLPKYSLQSIQASRDAIKKRWLEGVSNIAESAAQERVTQIKRAWSNVRQCEQMFEDSKSIGDKVKVKQLELQYMQYIAKLNFVDSIIETDSPDTQVNIVSYSNND